MIAELKWRLWDARINARISVPLLPTIITCLSSLGHGHIQDLAMGRHKKTNKIGGRRSKDETECVLFFSRRKENWATGRLLRAIRSIFQELQTFWISTTRLVAWTSVIADELEYQEKPTRGKTEHLCVQVSLANLKQLVSTDATYSTRYTFVCSNNKVWKKETWMDD